MKEAGLRHYFAVPGDFNLLLLDEFLKVTGLEMIGCCNELNAGYAADGYARSNGLAALVLTYGVGGLSALNAVTCAYAEDLPIIVIMGGINSDSLGRNQLIHHALGEVRYDYQRRIYAEVTAGAFTIEHEADAPGKIDRAIDPGDLAPQARDAGDRLQPCGLRGPIAPPEAVRRGPHERF